MDDATSVSSLKAERPAGRRCTCRQVQVAQGEGRPDIEDPTYMEKLARIRSILSGLQPDDAFFSIDEYGPFAIKSKPGRTLAPPGVQPTVPQWQKSRGCLIMTAAIELSSNQVTHFYSVKKNTGEMIRMMHTLINLCADRRKLYLSWDAASWHISKKLFARIEADN